MLGFSHQALGMDEMMLKGFAYLLYCLPFAVLQRGHVQQGYRYNIDMHMLCMDIMLM